MVRMQRGIRAAPKWASSPAPFRHSYHVVSKGYTKGTVLVDRRHNNPEVRKVLMRRKSSRVSKADEITEITFVL